MANTANIRRQTILGAAAGFTLACGRTSWAQTPADKPMRFILPMAPGSVGDTLARGLVRHLSLVLKRPVLVENLPGAGGMTGTAQLVRSASDGTALALVSSSHVINPFIFKNMLYDPIKDVTPITVIGKSMMVLVVNPAVAAQTVAEFIQLLKASPGKFNYGSSGNGGVTHLPVEMFNREAGVSTHHIPYRGLAAQVTDTVGGTVEFGAMPVGVAAPHVRSGRLRALAVTGATRSALLPQVPTLRESGLGGYLYEPWLAIIGPAGLSAAQVQSIYSSVQSALQQADIRSLMEAQDVSPVVMSPADTAAYFQSELLAYGALAKHAGLRPE